MKLTRLAAAAAFLGLALAAAPPLLAQPAQPLTNVAVRLDGEAGGVGDIKSVAIATTSPITGGATCWTGACSFTLGLGTVPVANGGSGIATTTAYSLVMSGTTATGAWAATIGPGTATQVLTSNGAGAYPTWQAAGGGGSPGGSSGQLQYNNASAFGGTSSVVFSVANDTVPSLFLTSPFAAKPGLTIGGAASQSVDLLRFQSSAPAILSRVSSGGVFVGLGGNVTAFALGGLTSADPALKKSSSTIGSKAVLDVVAADLSAYFPISASYFSLAGGPAVGASPDATLGIAVYQTGAVSLSALGHVYASGFRLYGGGTNTVAMTQVGDTNVAAIGTTTVGNASGWLSTGGASRVAANVTNATTTMGNITGLSATLNASRFYTGRVVLYVANSTAVDGIKIDFDGGTATMTNFRSHCTITDAALLTSAQTSAIATDVTAATVTGDALVECRIGFTVNAAGTFIPRAAENSTSTGTLTVYRESYMQLTDTL